MNLEFVVERKGMQKNIRIELFNVKSVNGGIQIKGARKLQNTRRIALQYGSLKIGNFNIWQI